MLDCLDFDDHLRHVDALDDVAFLVVDLERLGRADLGTIFLDTYAEFSGDPAPPSLRHHYIAYRALVRAKVACLCHDQTGADPDAEAAVGYALLARRHLRTGAVRLALVGDLPGTGKSTLAGALADRCGAVLLSSDRVGKDLAGLDLTESATAGFGEGLYSAEHTEALYSDLLKRAETPLARDESVVLDASWTDRRQCAAAAALAARSFSDLVPLQCRTPAEVAAQRIHARGATASDATAAIRGDGGRCKPVARRHRRRHIRRPRPLRSGRRRFVERRAESSAARGLMGPAPATIRSFGRNGAMSGPPF